MFKKGDVIVRTACSVGQVEKGGTYTVDYLKKDSSICLAGVSGRYDPYSFKLKKPVAKNKGKDYIFKTITPLLIDESEIVKDLSRERPLAIVKCNDGTVSVTIHGSIYNKLIYMPVEYSNNLAVARDELRTYNKLSDGKLGAVIKAVRDIRTGSILKEYRNPVEVTVTIPNI